MKYKAEVVRNGGIHSYHYFDLSHPNQVVRNVVQRLKGKLDYFIIYVVNDMGEVWKYSVMKKPDNKLYVRKMEKGNIIYTRDDLDMIFTGNKSIFGGFVA